MTTLSQQIAVYEEMRNVLEADYFGKYVIFHNRTFIGAYDSFQDAAVVAVERFGRGPYLIRQVGAGPVTLPASILYRPVNANR